jgi:chromosome segregation ATPase
MKPGIKRIVFYLLFALALGLAVYFGYSSYRLTMERNHLASALADEQQKFKILQRKYAEEKAQVAQLQRAKRTVEGQLVNARQELEVAREERDTLEQTFAARYAGKIASLESANGKYVERIEKLQEILEQYKTKLAEAVDVARERHAAILKLEADKQDLAADLQESRSGLRRCEGHNVKLSRIAEELVMAYKTKGVGASLAQSEPFTQIKEVDAERIVQEYLDRIDNDNMELLKQAR